MTEIESAKLRKNRERAVLISKYPAIWHIKKGP
jgi:hypothetical protein